MNVSDMEFVEALELVELLSERLGRAIVSECSLNIRVKGLVKALDRAETGRTPDASQKLGQLIVELAEARSELQDAKDQWAEYTERTESDIQALRQEVVDSEILHKADAETIKSLHLTLEDQRTCLAARDMDARRLERELRENRANVMNEVSAMIPKAVQAERDSCADLCRQAALQCVNPANAEALMKVVNMIKERK